MKLGRSCYSGAFPKMSAHFRKSREQKNLSFYSSSQTSAFDFSFTRLGLQNSFPTISSRLSLYKSSLWHICIAYEDCYWRFICSVQLNNLRTSNSLPESTICLWPVGTSSNPARWPTIHHEHETSPECDYHPVPPRNLSHKSVQNLYEQDVHHPKWIHWENFQCPRDWWRRQNNYTRVE